MRIGIGADNNGFHMKNMLKEHLKSNNFEVIDYGCYTEEAVDYPDIAFKVASEVASEKIDRAILICGTGIGVAIAAGKHPGIRAALCHDTYSAERAQLSNNAQIITLGAQIIGHELAKKVVDAYLNVEWAKGSERKVNKIIEGESKFYQKP